MTELSLKPIFLSIILFIITVNARRECIQRKVPNADTMCVCNATYCDDFPPLKKPSPGMATVFESSKTGDRFKETQLKISTKPINSEEGVKSVIITIDSKLKYQSIHGFGGAFTDASGVMLKSVNNSLAELLMESYFGPNGIEYSMARIPIGATDYSVRPYTYDDYDEDLELKHFALQMEDLEWKIPYIQKALKISPHKIKLFGSPWYAPPWMKTNLHFLGWCPLRGKTGGEYYQSWANYLVKFLNEYKSHGIDFWGLTPKNEPMVGWGNWGDRLIDGINVTHMHRDFIKMNLGPALEKAGYGPDKLKLMIYDDNSIRLKEFTEVVLSDKEAAKYVSGIAYHWYTNRGTPPEKILTEIHNEFPHHFMLNTEASLGAGDPRHLGDWKAGESYAYDIMRALNNYVTGWVEWNLFLDMQAGPRWEAIVVNGHLNNFGGCVNIDPAKQEAYKQPAFYAIGHISKFVSPDSVRIGHNVDKPIEGLTFLTVRRPDNQTVLVALNANNEDIVLNINDSNNHLSHKITAHSIQSYIW